MAIANQSALIQGQAVLKTTEINEAGPLRRSTRKRILQTNVLFSISFETFEKNFHIFGMLRFNCENFLHDFPRC